MLRKATVWLAILLCAMATSVDAQKSESPLARCWHHGSSPSYAAGIVSDAANVFFVENDGRVTALDRTNGAITWRSELGGKIETPIVSAGDALYIVSTVSNGDGRAKSNSIRSISRTTGITNWSADLSSTGPYFAKASNGTLVLRGSDGSIVGIDVLNGKQKWSRAVQSVVGADPSIGAETVAIKQTGAKIDVVSLKDGGTLRTYPLGSKAVIKVSAVGGTFVVSDVSGKIASADGDWSYKTGGAVTHLLPVDGNILAASADNFIYSLAASSGNVEWKRRMPGRIASLALLSEKTAAVTVVGEATVYLIELEDGRFIGQLQLSKGEELLASPPAGDERFVAVLTTAGVTAFSNGCGNGKSGV